MRVVITGGAGLQGSKLATKLIQMGHDVTVADNFQRGSHRVKDAQIVGIDLRYSHLEELLRHTDYLFHLAAHVGGVEYIQKKDQEVMLDNLRVDSNVIAGAQAAKVRNFIFASTACVYPVRYQQNWDSILSEEMAFNPVEPESGYGWAKLTAEYQLNKVQDMKVAILRLFNVYGPGEDFLPGSHVVPELIRKTLAPGDTLTVYGSGEAGRCFTYVDDAVDAYIAMMNMGMGKGPINIGSPDPIRIKDLADLIMKIAGSKKLKKFDLSKPVGMIGRTPNLERAKSILGWEAKVPLNAGLELTIDWMKKETKESGR